MLSVLLLMNLCDCGSAVHTAVEEEVM